jgi:hypothetical protein
VSPPPPPTHRSPSLSYLHRAYLPCQNSSSPTSTLCPPLPPPCCSCSSFITDNIGVVNDVVNGTFRPVLALTSLTEVCCTARASSLTPGSTSHVTVCPCVCARVWVCPHCRTTTIARVWGPQAATRSLALQALLLPRTTTGPGPSRWAVHARCRPLYPLPHVSLEPSPSAGSFLTWDGGVSACRL